MGSLKYQVRVGSDTSFSNDGITANARLIDSTLRAGINDIQRRFELRLNGLEKKLQAVVEREYEAAIQYAVRHMLGTIGRYKGADNHVSSMRILINPKDRMGDSVISGVNDSVVWTALTANTVRKKLSQGGAGNSRKFFQDTGQLRSYLTAHSKRMAKRTGAVRIYTRNLNNRIQRITNMKSKLPLSALRIRVAPRIPSLAFESDNGLLEKTLGISGTALQKLMGQHWDKTKVQRPLLRPVMAFYTKHMISRRLSLVLSQLIKQQSSSGVAGNMVDQ